MITARGFVNIVLGLWLLSAPATFGYTSNHLVMSDWICGILAIFFMIVVEKTRDIGILKSLGASSAGVAGIFLGYGLFLGLVGAGAGLALGLGITWNINRIRTVVEWCTGERVFDPSIYYFFRIPTIVDAWTVAWIIAGAVGIAVAASVLPALRAARLHPVEALRHD